MGCYATATAVASVLVKSGSVLLPSLPFPFSFLSLQPLPFPHSFWGCPDTVDTSELTPMCARFKTLLAYQADELLQQAAGYKKDAFETWKEARHDLETSTTDLQQVKQST